MNIKIGGIYGISKLFKGWAKGVEFSGDNYCIYNLDDPSLDEMDCFFQFNIYNPRLRYKNRMHEAFSYILQTNKPYIVWEEGGFRQFQDYKRFGWYSYRNDTGIFNNTNVDDSRWKKFKQDTNIVIKDWKSNGDYILIMGQVPLDSATLSLPSHGCNDFNEWVEMIVKTIRMYSDRPIVIRPHPKSIDEFKQVGIQWNYIYNNISISDNFYGQDPKLNHGGDGLFNDLSNAYCVVTFNSNSIVEALCEGIPVYALDSGSIAYDIAHHDLSMIENLNYNIDITTWCNKVAYTMWNANEVKRGETWAHLKPVMF